VNTQALSTSIERSGAEPLAIGIAAGDEITLRRLEALAAEHGLSVVARAATLAELATGTPMAAVVVACDPAVVADREGLRELKAASPGLGLLVVLESDAASAIRGALRAGADGVILEAQLEVLFGPGVRAVAAGLVTVPRAARSHVERQPLSSREKQVLALVVMGFTNAEIGGRLFLAESTVKSHLSSAFSKLGVRSRKDAVALILDPEEGLGTGILSIARPDARGDLAARGNGHFARPTITEKGLVG
jgi:DNA-binding NarL/FixJ family response regulator